MKLGEKADLIIKSDYGYGEQGAPPSIPGNSTLIFTVELIQIEDQKAARFTKSDEELHKEALGFKDQAASKFKASQFKDAASLYKEANKVLG